MEDTARNSTMAAAPPRPLPGELDSLALPEPLAVWRLDAISDKGGPSYHIATYPAHMQLDIVWPGATSTEKAQWDVVDREIMIRFEQPLLMKDPNPILEHLGDWLSDLRYGYDTLMLHANGNSHIVGIYKRANRVRVVMSKLTKSDELTATEQVVLNRLEFLMAKNRIVEGSEYRGRAILKDTVYKSPDNIEFVSELGIEEQSLGRWRPSLHSFSRALKLAPGEPNIISQKTYLESQHAPTLTVGVSSRSVNVNDEVQEMQWGRAALPLAKKATVGAEWWWNNTSIENLQRVAGDQSDFSGGRGWGEGYLEWDHDNRNVSRYALFANTEAQMGAGYRLQIPTESYRFTLDGYYRKPYWSLAGGIADGGVSDRLEFRVDTTDIYGWGIAASAAYNIFGVTGHDDAAYSSDLFFGLRYDLLGPALTLNYTFDYEHVHERERSVNEAGATFDLLALTGSNAHTLGITWADDLTDYLSGLVALRYNEDFKNRIKRPASEMRLVYRPLSDFQTDLFFTYDAASQDGITTHTGTLGTQMTFLY